MPTPSAPDDLDGRERGPGPDLERFEPREERRRPQRRFTPSRAAARRAVAPGQRIITEGPDRTSVRVRERIYRRWLALADAIAALVAITLTASVFGEDDVGWAAFAVLPLVVLLNKVAGLYERDKVVLKRSTLDEAPMLFQLAGLFALVSWLLGDRLIAGELDDRQVLGLWALVFAGSLTGRSVARAVAGWRAAAERCIVIGEPSVADRVRGRMRDSRLNAEVVAALPLEQGQDVASLRDIESFRRLVTDLRIDRVILAPVSTDSADMLELIRIAKGVGVRVSVLPRMLEVMGSSVAFDDLDGMAMLGVRRFGLSRSSRVLKRGFDLVGATLGLVAVTPLVAVLVLVLRRGSPGPVLVRGTRVGRDGEHFEMFKLRSGDGPGTRIGRFVRRTSLDELPQLLNVLRGEMSLVGPRPLVFDEDAEFGDLFRSRLHLTPGMTGPWQVLGAGRVPVAEMVKVDYLYVVGWSLWTDVKLLLRTVPHMLSRGAA